jgi:hypothetical protein
MASVISVTDGNIRVEVGEIIDSVKNVMTNFGEEFLTNSPFAIAIGGVGILFIVLCAVIWAQKRATKKRLKKIARLKKYDLASQDQIKVLDKIIKKSENDVKKLTQDKQKLEQEIADKIGRRKLSNLEALREFYGVDFFKELEVSPVGELKQSSGVDENPISVPIFNKEVLTNLKEMAEVIGAVITIGPDDNGKALAENVAAEMKVPMQELHDFVKKQLGDGSDSINKSLETLTDGLVKKLEDAKSAPEVDLDKLVEKAIKQYQVDIDKRLTAIQSERSGIHTWTVAELNAESSNQLDTIKKKVIIVNKSVDEDLITRLLAGDRQALMKQLEKSVEGLELIPKMVSTKPVVDINDSTDPIDLLEMAALMLKKLNTFVYLSEVDMTEDSIDEDDLQTVGDFEKAQRNK